MADGFLLTITDLQASVLADALHYPEEWDTVAYPSLYAALMEISRPPEPKTTIDVYYSEYTGPFHTTLPNTKHEEHISISCEGDMAKFGEAFGKAFKDVVGVTKPLVKKTVKNAKGAKE